MDLINLMILFLLIFSTGFILGKLEEKEKRKKTYQDYVKEIRDVIEKERHENF